MHYAYGQKTTVSNPLYSNKRSDPQFSIIKVVSSKGIVGEGVKNQPRVGPRLQPKQKAPKSRGEHNALVCLKVVVLLE